MYSIKLYEQILYPKIQMLIMKFAACSGYLCGSFLNKELWMLGISDIDLILFTHGSTTKMGSLDMTEEVYTYFKRKNSVKDKVYLSYKVYPENIFVKISSWDEFFMMGKIVEAGIITDQVFFANHYYVSGNKVSVPEVSAREFRRYIRAITPFLVDKPEEYDLFLNAKLILYAARIFKFLWTGYYEHNMNYVLEWYYNVSRSAYLIIRNTMEIISSISRGTINYQMESSAYYKHGHYLLKRKKELFDELLSMDCTYCKRTGELPITSQFIYYQALVKR